MPVPKSITLPGYSYGARAESARYLIIHHTKVDLDTTLRLLTTEGNPNAHYVIDKDGTVYSIVPEAHIAHHAGQGANSRWEGDCNLNRNSIGIELVNSGHEAFPEEQVTALVELARTIIASHNIKPYYVLGHSDIAPDRKDDPGPHFPWQRLAEAGVGLYPNHPIDIVSGGAILARIGDENDIVVQLQQLLAEYGYPIQINGRFDATTVVNVIAFRHHFLPYNLSPVWDQACAQVLQELLELKAQYRTRGREENSQQLER